MNISPKAVSNFAEVIKDFEVYERRKAKERREYKSNGSLPFLVKKVADLPDKVPFVVLRGGGSFMRGDHIHRDKDVVFVEDARGAVGDEDIGAFPKKGLIVEVNLPEVRKRLELKRAEVLELEATINKALGLPT